MAKLRKPFYRVEEIATRWGMTVDDVAAFVPAGHLTISVVVVGVTVTYGEFEEIDDEQWQRMPYGHKRLVGPVDLHPSDAWHVIRNGSLYVRFFKGTGHAYFQITDPEHPDGYVVPRADLVVRLEELERFEREQGIGESERPEVVLVGTPRGAQPRYDWDAFWIEVCRSTYSDGLPGSQADLVRRMRDWFETTGSVPDDSTIKKKLSPLWRALHATDLRQSA